MINEYIQRYGRRLYGLCRYLCTSSFEADDLYQETWLRALDNFSKYNPSMEFEPWLTKICVNIYRNSLRRIRRSPIINFLDNKEKDSVIESVNAASGEDYLLLYEAVNSLPDKLRLSVVLFYFRDMNIDETARILGVPTGTVKSRLNKARRLLKEALGDEADV